MKTVAVIGASTAAVAVVGALLAAEQASKRDAQADESVRGGTSLLAAAEARRRAEEAAEDAEAAAQRLLENPDGFSPTSLLDNYRNAGTELRKAIADEKDKRRAWDDARLPDGGRAPADARKALYDAEKKTLEARSALALARSTLLAEKRAQDLKKDGAATDSPKSAAEEQTKFDACLAGAGAK